MDRAEASLSDYLAPSAPETTLPLLVAAECERTFSSAGCMVSSKRSRLDASTIPVTQTVRSWLRAGLLDGYGGLLKEVGGC